MPFVKTRTRSPPWPRMIGRDAPAPKNVDETPGSDFSVSPIVPAKRLASSSPVNTETPVMASSTERVRGEPVTIISSLSASCA